ncbi:MAG: hypothetical protein WC656_01660 [Sulfurimonas sp.]|jgi:hypothetical protein
MSNKIIKFVVVFFLLINNLKAETTAVQRDAFFFTDRVTSTTSTPSALQYYDYKENLADEISIDVYKNKDFSNLQGKRIFVGYGVIDPTGDDCKVFTPDVTGQENNITVCLPWWRIEREYATSSTQGSGVSFTSFLSKMQRPRPPKNVSVCDAWDASQKLPGGTVTCTTYYDKSISDDCYKNPLQAQCRKDNCGSWVKNNCTRSGRSIGHERESLDNIELNSTAEKRYESKVNLITEQYICPEGNFTNTAVCTNMKEVAMNPYECKADDTATPLDDSIMKYCDESRPVRDVASGAIKGFLGTCPAEASASNTQFEVTCTVNNFSQTRNTCTDYGASLISSISELLEQSYDLHYTEQKVRVLSGAIDRFADREDCVRANTVESGRDKSAYIIASGSGSLDDDIYLTVHHSDDTHTVEYCNQQHNDVAGSKLNFSEMGAPVQCIQNSGNYSFNKNINISAGDVISVQQTTENEDGGYHGAAGSFELRTHYSSSKVVIDGVEATPDTYPGNFPFHPTSMGSFINLWENTLGSLSIMFPYAGVYTLYFYSESGELVASKEVGAEDFKTLNSGTGYKQLFLASSIPIAPTLDKTNESTLCLNDNWADYGGGVYGGKASVSGTPCQEPSIGNTYQKSKAIKRVVVKDMLTNSFTVIPLVYPLGYPNRVYISKVKLYEDRVYHCYEQPEIAVPLGGN